MFLTLLAGVFKVFHENPSILTFRALAEFVGVLVISFCLGAIAKMIALAFTRWQFARRCREQYEVLSQLMQGSAAH
jgi:hypothetical protein